MFIIFLLNNIYEHKHEKYILIDVEYQIDTKDDHIFQNLILRAIDQFLNK